MIGKIFITSSGYDPELGKQVADPFLGPKPSLGACRPDLRRQLNSRDHLFVVSGKVPGANQFIMCGFEVESKISAQEAYELFPEQRLMQHDDGHVTGNIIVDGKGQHHALDTHSTFESRVDNYIVGTNPLILASAGEIARGRLETIEVLRDVLGKRGRTPFEVVGRFGSTLNEEQIAELRKWIASVKGLGDRRVS